jgi:hypothetical protein
MAPINRSWQLHSSQLHSNQLGGTGSCSLAQAKSAPQCFDPTLCIPQSIHPAPCPLLHAPRYRSTPSLRICCCVYHSSGALLGDASLHTLPRGMHATR